MKITKLFIAAIMMFAIALSAVAQDKVTPVPKKDKAKTETVDHQSTAKASDNAQVKSASGVKDKPIAKKYSSKKVKHGKHNVAESKKKEATNPPHQK